MTTACVLTVRVVCWTLAVMHVMSGASSGHLILTMRSLSSLTAVVLRIVLNRSNVKALLLTARLDQVFADRKSTRLNSSHLVISYAAFCLKKKKNKVYMLKIYCRSPALLSS